MAFLATWHRLEPIIRDGQVMVDLSFGGQRFRRRVARLVLEAFVGPHPPRPDAEPRNGDTLDCRLANLCWARQEYALRKRFTKFTGRSLAERWGRAG